MLVKPITPSKPISDFYQACVAQCARWFGSPPDIDWPTEFYSHRWDNLARDTANRCYRVALQIPSEDNVTLAEDIAHLSFKRVCYYHPGPWKFRWVYEVLAQRAAWHLLTNESITALLNLSVYEVMNHLERLSAYARQWEPIVDIPKTIQWRWPLLLLYRTPGPEYGAAIRLLGERLEQIVGWEGLCSLARSRSYDDWLRSLPAGQRGLVDQAVRGG